MLSREIEFQVCLFYWQQCEFTESQTSGVGRKGAIISALCAPSSVSSSENYDLFSSEMKTCHPEHFQCTSGHCVPKALACDGRADCLDASDESACRKYLLAGGSVHLSAHEGQFRHSPLLS